jgi:hypothetical protein
MLQGVAEQEINLNNDESCTESCSYYEHAESYLHGYNCNGRYYNCRYVEPHASICPAGPNSTRRYEYVEFDDGPTLGKKGDGCRQPMKRVESWHYWFWHCSTCMCICDQQGKDSDRFFSLRDSVSDVDKNM